MNNDNSKANGNNGGVGYNRFLLLVAGLGGSLYGVDVGIISGALPYLQATFKDAAGQLLKPDQVSFVVAAFLLGTVFSTLFAGMLADWLGRRTIMLFSGILFVASVPMIALAHSYDALVLGRVLQGCSGGLIGVSVPLYLAECLGASSRGKGTAIFQLLLTLGIVSAAFIGLYFSGRVDAVAQLKDPEKLLAFKDTAWRGVFWVSLPPGILFVLGTFFVAESPRWLFRRGNVEAARTALLRSRSEAQTEVELKEMAEMTAAKSTAGGQVQESLLKRKYVLPFLLACVILTCNQGTGINSIIGYNSVILIQAGLGDKLAHLCNLFFTIINSLTTIVAVALVDRKGRKYLLSLGTAGIVVAMICAGLLFMQTEKSQVDVKDALQAEVIATNQTLTLQFNTAKSAQLLPRGGFGGHPSTLVVIYSYGDFHGATPAMRSDDFAAEPVKITRESCLPQNRVISFFKNPFADLKAAQTAPLKIDHALVTPVPGTQNGWMTAILLFVYVSFFAVGPGVCVWLALSELMPTRIRSNGMSIALLINQAVSTTIAAVFLPTVGAHGYSTMFFVFAGFAAVYFVTAAFFLPETKGKTLEEIEELFEHKKA